MLEDVARDEALVDGIVLVGFEMLESLWRDTLRGRLLCSSSVSALVASSSWLGTHPGWSSSWPFATDSDSVIFL